MCVRGQFPVRFHGRELCFEQVRARSLRGAASTTGCSVWDSAVVLGSLILSKAAPVFDMSSKACLELGSGCGVVGTCCVRLPGVGTGIRHVLPVATCNDSRVPCKLV